MNQFKIVRILLIGLLLLSGCGGAYQSLPDQPTGKAEYQAGTGMGTREHHPVRTVQFDFDDGMYDTRDALVVYYDFDRSAHQWRHNYQAVKSYKGRNFRMEIISDRSGRKLVGSRYGRPYVTAHPGEKYSIVLYNPLPVTVAVNLTIDGLNSISGAPSTPSGDRKWLIDPHSSIRIKGWQVSDQHGRRFYFTSKEASYASWRSNEWGSDLSVNCGVIGAAFFWSKKDLKASTRRVTGFAPEM